MEQPPVNRIALIHRLVGACASQAMLPPLTSADGLDGEELEAAAAPRLGRASKATRACATAVLLSLRALFTGPIARFSLRRSLTNAAASAGGEDEDAEAAAAALAAARKAKKKKKHKIR